MSELHPVFLFLYDPGIEKNQVGHLGSAGMSQKSQKGRCAAVAAHEFGFTTNNALLISDGKNFACALQYRTMCD